MYHCSLPVAVAASAAAVAGKDSLHVTSSGSMTSVKRHNQMRREKASRAETSKAEHGDPIGDAARLAASQFPGLATDVWECEPLPTLEADLHFTSDTSVSVCGAALIDCKCKNITQSVDPCQVDPDGCLQDRCCEGLWMAQEGKHHRKPGCFSTWKEYDHPGRPRDVDGNNGAQFVR